MVPARTAPMLTSGQKPGPALGRNRASTPPSAPPIMSSGASTPPEVPEPSENAQITDFTSRMPRMRVRVESPRRRSPISVVADAEGGREDEAAETDDEAADAGPPHPVDGETAEEILGGVDRLRQQHRKDARQQAHEHAAEQAQRADEGGVGGRGKQGPEAEEIAARGCRR